MKARTNSKSSSCKVVAGNRILFAITVRENEKEKERKSAIIYFLSSALSLHAWVLSPLLPCTKQCRLLSSRDVLLAGRSISFARAKVYRGLRASLFSGRSVRREADRPHSPAAHRATAAPKSSGGAARGMTVCTEKGLVQWSHCGRINHVTIWLADLSIRPDQGARSGGHVSSVARAQKLDPTVLQAAANSIYETP